MREHININEVENPLFYLNENNPAKYKILGNIECFVFDAMFNSIYKVNVNNGEVKILSRIYAQYVRDIYTNYSYTYDRNGFIYAKNEGEAFDLLKSVWKLKIKECQDTEAIFNNLLEKHK